MTEENYKWISFYMEFADKLLTYKDNRKLLIEKILRLWDNIDMNMPMLELNNEIEDMDPFTIFGLFNKNFTVNNRIDILKFMKEEFDIQSEVPPNFDGIPRLNPQSATFYSFKNKRNNGDINNLWEVFESAINYVNTGDSINFIESYDKALNQIGIRWNLSMALYWIRPYDFISLDKNNKEFLSKASNFDIEISNMIKDMKNPPKAEEYLSLCSKCNKLLKEKDFIYKDFPSLSNNAYIQSQENDNVNNENNGIGDSEDNNEVNYWLYAPGQGAKKWEKYSQNSLMGIGWSNIGDLTQYSNRKEIIKKFQTINQNNSKYSHDSLALWQFANEIKVGDIIFAKKGMHEILGYGIVESEYFYDETLDFEHFHMLKVNWKEKGHYPYDGTLAMKTLTKITDYPELLNKIKDNFESSPEELEEEPEYPEYTVDDFLDEVYMTEDNYKTLSNLLKYKKNIILQGAPGVGKTFIAKRLAYSLLGCKDKSKVSMVQFHQSYSYEDFILGYRPNTDGFDLREGIFYNFCKIASEDEDNDYYFIIDEINRGNLSKIFGELFMLLENDKRGSRNKIHLLYKDELFYIPENVYIIGMMNTADRSLALLDYALRRRFAFYNLEPGFDSDKFMEYEENLDNQQFTKLIDIIKQLNIDITMDESLGKGFVIGHSYFSNLKKDTVDKKLNYIIEYEIIPLLEEYWFDEEDKVSNWSYRLRSVLL